MANADNSMDTWCISVRDFISCSIKIIYPSSMYDYDTHKLVLGTHTCDGEQNYLMAANVKLPMMDKTEKETRVKGRIDIQIKISHQGEINRYIWIAK